jgi:primosomal protein N' (replication factor Y)
LIARVIPLTTTRAVRGLFDYRLPDNADAVSVGSLVRVPFAGRALQAVVAELADSSELPDERLATVASVLPVSLPADLVSLAQWMAREYCSTPARALTILLPPGISRGLREKQILTASITSAGTRALSDGTRLTSNQSAALDALQLRGQVPASELGTPLLRRLESRGLVQLTKQTVRRRPARHSVSVSLAEAPPLTAEQSTAVKSILDAYASSQQSASGMDGDAGATAAPRGQAQSFLLHGVTGSGKTEVYLQAAKACLDAGRGVIILVPEIALTPQALARFEARLGEVVAVLHSGMSEGARFDEWNALRNGAARVCVGPRSAVFAPLSDIGLIVVDEEHESSYKHEGDPRYDARTVAEERARVHGAVLVVGSATPRPESAMGHRILQLTQRVDQRPLPKVEILDMRGLHHPLHPEVRLALADCRRQRGKAIVLLNRRGWSNYLSCGSCGRVWMCPDCEVALVLHNASGEVACHHCGHLERVPERCPDCGSVSVARHGAGTERLEHELTTMFGADDFPVLRLDADSTGLDARAQVLERFHAERSAVLIGTQMIAKGHDFDDVSLGVVIDADQTLRFPDFRAEERTFALVTQLAGRAGRRGEGRVLVQTRAPEARSIMLAAAHDSDTFLRGELRRRKALGYPPFTTLIRIVCSAPDRDIEPARATAQELRTRIDPPGVEVLGPASLFALRGRARAQLVIKAEDREIAIRSVGAAIDDAVVSRGRGVAMSVDVDPQ